MKNACVYDPIFLGESGMKFVEQNIQIRDQQLRLTYAKEVPVKKSPCYWATLWPSAWALAEHVIHTEDIQGKKVLELGCGCGLAGIAAGQKGADVTVTDTETEALKLAEKNWSRNNLSPASVEELDWCYPEIDDRFDYILAADVLYNPLDYSAITRSTAQLLDPKGTLLLSEPGRPRAGEFFAKMIHNGFRINTAHYQICLHGKDFDVGVSEFR